MPEPEWFHRGAATTVVSHFWADGLDFGCRVMSIV
jgi:hypothetical protein